MWNRINKKERISEWIDWCEIPIKIIQPDWGESIPRGVYRDKRDIIEINGNQSDKEIIKSIIHEVCHWINGDRAEDPDIWERESRCRRVESQWKVSPDEVSWE
jgi:hypothetical protein